jgi:hypothetical protein
MQPVFVFGSNTKGRHGKGAALFARQERGAIYGQAEGLQGNSYGIPTRDGSEKRITTLPLSQIEWHVKRFILFAIERDDLTFEVTRIGCLNAGYTENDIAPMFAGAPNNCILPDGWRVIIANKGRAQ